MKRIIIPIALILLVIITAGCGAITTTTPTIVKTLPPTTSPTPITATPSAMTTSAAVKTTTPAATTAKPNQPAATVTGLVYYRDAATSFTVDAAPADKAVTGAAVAIDKETLTTDASGKYNFSDVTPGYHTITVTAPGYIPAQVSWTFASKQSYVFNIGLYKAPAAVTPRPGFISGIITWDAGGWLNDVYYKPGFFPTTYSAAAQNAGGNLVTVSDPVFIHEADASHVVMSNVSMSGSYWQMMSETQYTALVKDAHSKGLQFMLWLGVMDEGKTNYNNIIWTNGPRSASFWDTWFSEYQKYAVQYAALAGKLGMEYINLGHDMGYATGSSRFSGGAADCLARWQKLITAIRAVYNGKLSYFGGADIVGNYYEDNDYPPGFVNLFNAVGINVQSVNTTFNPSLSEIKTSITALLDRYSKWERPIFVMVRTPSVDGCTSLSDNVYIEPLLAVNHEADKHAMNLFQQADMYEALNEVINGRPAGAGQVMGVFPWGYNYTDNYLLVPGKSDGQMAMDKSANIRGKPAEAVMKFWSFR